MYEIGKSNFVYVLDYKIAGEQFLDHLGEFEGNID
jgi:hypothetical protein